MDELERLLKELKAVLAEINQLKESVILMKESMELILTRADQLFKLQETQVAVLPRLAEQLTSTKDNIEILHEEFVESLDQLEATTDDLANATAGLLTIQQQQNQENQENESANQ